MKRFSKAIALGVTALGTGLISTAAMAQVEVITVTAQKREQTLLETPVAVTAVSADQIEESGIKDVRDLQTLVPSLTIAQFSRPGVTEFGIRGIATSGDNIGLEPSVGVFVDGVYRSRSGAAINDFLSLERVEVLRGPQSTLFGKNTPAGVIAFHTAKPEYEAGGAAELTVGNNALLVAKGTITGPIVEDTLAFRLDAVRHSRDGFLKNVATGDDVNNRDRYDVRGQLLWDISDNTSVRFIGDYGVMDEDCCAAPFSYHRPQNLAALQFLGATIVRADPFRREVAFDGAVNTEIKTRGLSAEVNHDFGELELTSITAWRGYDDTSRIDADFTDLALTGSRYIDTGYKTFTQELRIADNNGGNFDWLAGVYYYSQDLTYDSQVPYGAMLRPFMDLATGGAIAQLESALNVPTGTFLAGELGGVKQGLTNENYAVDTRSWSVFGQGDWYINDRLTLTAGLRYSKEEKDIDAKVDINDPFSALNFVAIGEQQIAAAAFFQATGLPLTPANIALAPQAYAGATAYAAANKENPQVNALLGLRPLQFNPPASDYARSRSEDNVSGTLKLSYDVNPLTNVYASYSRGYKAGGFNVSAFAVVNDAVEFDPEVADTIELGLKTRLFNETLQVNTALFDTKLKDFQANTFTGTSFVLDNAGEVMVRGLEVENVWVPNEDWTFTGGFTYLLDNEYSEYKNAPCDDLNVSAACLLTNTQDLTGRRLSASSKLVGSVTGMRFFTVMGLDGYIRGEAYYRSAYNMGSDLDPRKVQDEFWLFNASAQIAHPESNWALQAWVRNLANKDYLQGTFSSVGQPGSMNAYVGDPRTYGLTLRLNF
ncbi:TonB-dependent receptor [Woodsholea maritima]|uniref:TonB-dependent receptor n=1 Tax=Woodsholea maritima TaxID=240237 RepID=UPI0003744A9F|nr:TonB-dependent receptor [Woodsholea maritima]